MKRLLFLIFCSLPLILLGRARYIQSTHSSVRRQVSIIIPARNEAHRLPRLLKSIRRQQQVEVEVIVADDQSTDNTRAIAQEYGTDVVDVESHTWSGKSYACYVGVQTAHHECLLFMDADTFFTHPYALKDFLGNGQSQGVLSVQPYHETGGALERLASVFNIVTVVGMNIFSLLPHMQTSCLFGPVMLTHREDYWRIGGHRVAKDAVMEGEALYRAYARAGIPIDLRLGKGYVHFRMYHSLSEMVRGFRKHIAVGSSQTHPWVMTLVMLWLSGSMIAVASRRLSTLLCYGLSFFVLSRRVISTRLSSIVTFPLHVLFFFYVYGLSWYSTKLRKQVEWKGRHIEL